MKLTSRILISTIILSTFAATSVTASAAITNTQLKNTQTNNQTNLVKKNPTSKQQNGKNTLNNLPKEPTISYTNYANNHASDTNNTYGFTHFTRYNLEHMQDGYNRTDSSNPIGDFNKSVSNVKLYDTRKGYQGYQMDVWDSWPLQDANGNVLNYHGYYLTFALVGDSKKSVTVKGNKVGDSRIFMFYQKVSDAKKGISSWKSAGPVFKSPLEGAGKNARTTQPILAKQKAQWSGDTIYRNGKIELFYTSYTGLKNDDTTDLMKAQIGLSATKSKVSINHNKAKNHSFLATPDGKMYQKFSQLNNDAYDENVFRDTHFFTYNGHMYLAFAGSLGSQYGNEGSDQLHNLANFGGDQTFRDQQYNLIDPTTDNPWHTPAADYNACIGLMELNSDYSMKQFMAPLVGFQTITDEFERPDVFQYNGKWYMFGITRGYKLATPDVKATDSYMLGFVSDNPLSGWKPLNGNGMVIRNTRSWMSRKYSYSFYPLNNGNKKNSPLVVTSYFTNSNNDNYKYNQTFGNSMLMKLTSDRAIIYKKTLQQNQLVNK